MIHQEKPLRALAVFRSKNRRTGTPTIHCLLTERIRRTSYNSRQFDWTHMELFGHASSGKRFCGGIRIVWLGAAVFIASFELALSEQFSGSAAESCLAVNRHLSLGAPLPRTALRLKSGERLLIVAIGSSSTVGLW